MAGDALLFLVAGGAFLAAFLALQGWSLGRQLRGDARWARGRPPEWAFAVPRFVARLGWAPRVVAAVLYLAGVAGTALGRGMPWVLVGFVGLALAAWTGHAAIVTRAVEKNRAAIEAQPPMDVRKRLGVALALGGAWTVLLAAVGVPLGWFREAPPFLVPSILAYGAAMGVVGLVLLRRSRGATTARPPR